MSVQSLRQYKSTMMLFLTVLVASTGLTACIQNFEIDVPRYADKESLMVSEETLRKINRMFYANFALGSWTYKGAKASAGEVRAYIKLPDNLNMNEEVQVRYVRDVLCPGSDETQLWQELKQINLSVHLYTKARNDGVSAICVSPLRGSV